MTDSVGEALQCVRTSKLTYCKFLSANDTGKTGAHQSGIYVAKNSVSILFDRPGIRGQNKDRFVEISWMDGSITNNRFIYYGIGTRNEYRITRFGRGFAYLKPDYIGSLFVLCKKCENFYQGFIFDEEDDISDFLTSLGISSTETGRLINDINVLSLDSSYQEIINIVSTMDFFPSSAEMSSKARKVYHAIRPASVSYDDELVDCVDLEYKLYRALEDKIYRPKILNGFSSVDEFESLAAELMNRRKSRAGKSLENHLAEIFTEAGLSFSSQVHTEGNKTSDFVFPSSDAYHDFEYPVEKIVTLGAKTTCKDRWRQVLNEADRVRNRQKFLCTLQQGITESQLQEMKTENLTLVVPQKYIAYYPSAFRNWIWPIERFIAYVKQIEGVR